MSDLSCVSLNRRMEVARSRTDFLKNPSDVTTSSSCSMWRRMKMASSNKKTIFGSALKIIFALEVISLFIGGENFINCASVVNIQSTTTTVSTTSSGYFPSSEGGTTTLADQNPDFTGSIQNVTAAVGRQAILSCPVSDLGTFKVGWMKADDGTILSVHNFVVTHNHRISVAQEGSMWQLRLRQLKETDRGCYTCQINTKPMKKQLGCIDVHVLDDVEEEIVVDVILEEACAPAVSSLEVRETYSSVPPDILDESSGDEEVKEGGTAKLTCRARGHPTPRIIWKREDGAHILLKNESTDVKKVEVYTGENLEMKSMDRKQMGAYLCIATNDIPPSVSKRIVVLVSFPPSVTVSQMMLGVPTGSDARLDCLVQAFPAALKVWIKNRNLTLTDGKKYTMSYEPFSQYEGRMSLIIKDFRTSDQGTFMCKASNTQGDADGTIRTYEIKITTTTLPTTTTTKMTTTTKAPKGVPINRYVVPAPTKAPKMFPEITTFYDTMDNIIEQSVVGNSWQATAPPEEIVNHYSSSAKSSNHHTVLPLLLPLLHIPLSTNLFNFISCFSINQFNFLNSLITKFNSSIQPKKQLYELILFLYIIPMFFARSLRFAFKNVTIIFFSFFQCIFDLKVFLCSKYFFLLIFLIHTHAFLMKLFHLKENCSSFSSFELSSINGPFDDR